jgi:hypothetical protein
VAYRDDREPAVLGDFGAHAPFGLIRALVNEQISGLRLAELMIIELLVAVGFQIILARFRLGKARIEEPFVVVSPRESGPFEVFEVIGGILAGRDAADFHFLPVGPALGDSVGDMLAVFRDRDPGERDGAVLRERVGIEEGSRSVV